MVSLVVAVRVEYGSTHGVWWHAMGHVWHVAAAIAALLLTLLFRTSGLLLILPGLLKLQIA